MITLDGNEKKAALRPANLFFVELLIVLLFFSLSAAIILRVFAAADYKQTLGELTEKSILYAQSVAECYSVTADMSATVDLVFGTSADITDGAAVLTLDDGFNASADGKVTLTLSEISREVTAAGCFTRLSIEFSLGEDELYALICSAYAPLTGGAAYE